MSSAGIPGKILVHQFMLINDYGTKDFTQMDIWPLVVGTSIYENIFSPFMYGVAKIKDSYNLYNTFPITSDTYLKVGLQDPTTGTIVQSLFRIYKISHIEQESTKLQTYIIHFTSAELFNARNVRVSKAVKGDIPKIVKEIHGLISKKNINIDEDTSKADLIIPYMTADKAIELLTENAKWKSLMPDYCYWETFTEFNFKSLASCLLSNPLHEFCTTVPMNGDINNNFNYADFIKVDEVISEKAFDAIETLYNGVDGTTLYDYDLSTGQIEVLPMGENNLSVLTPVVKGALDYKSILKRKQTLRGISNSFYYIRVPGLLDRSSGDMADVKIFNGNNLNVEDTTFSGRKLICGIVHTISTDEYYQNITLGDYYFSEEDVGKTNNA